MHGFTLTRERLIARLKANGVDFDRISPENRVPMLWGARMQEIEEDERANIPSKTCGTCDAAVAYIPSETDAPETADCGWCHRNPPVVGTDPRLSFFPAVSLSKTWCKRHKPKKASP